MSYIDYQMDAECAYGNNARAELVLPNGRKVWGEYSFDDESGMETSEIGLYWNYPHGPELTRVQQNARFPFNGKDLRIIDYFKEHAQWQEVGPVLP